MNKLSKIQDMLRTTLNDIENPDMIAVRSSLGGFVDFDRYDRFENMLQQIIEIPEYNRLSKIPQLGFVEHEFPSARHSRLEHCLGAFDLMRLLIYWSNRNYKKSRSNSWDFNIMEQAACAAAFLHDVGHAFPGHPFERAMKDMFPDTYHNHEKWSMEIIRRSEIYKILNSYFKHFADGVLEYVMAENNLPHSIWQQVYCGNLNIDTMDYLVRDSKQTNGGTIPVQNIIENVKFGSNPDGSHRLMLYPVAHTDFIRMLGMRGNMYADIYFSGIGASAESFLPIFFKYINKNIDSLRHHKNPFIKFIASRGTDYDAYLHLTRDSFYELADDLSRASNAQLGDWAKKYQDIPNNFSAESFYRGDADFAPDASGIKQDTIKNGGIFKDVTIDLYKANNPKVPEVYLIKEKMSDSDPKCPVDKLSDGEYSSDKFSDIHPDIANKKIRIINSFYAHQR